MNRLGQDLRLAVRRLRQYPAFTAVAVITLAIGIGANTTVFSLLNSILLRPLPVERPEELISVNNPRFGGVATHSYPNYVDFRDRNDVFTDLAGFGIAPVSFSRQGVNAHLWGFTATGNYFRMLGVPALLGRTFGPGDDRDPGAHPVVVLSHGCWQRRFAGAPDIIGQTARFNGLEYNIIGVMPAGFYGTEIWYRPEFWVPMMMQPQVAGNRGWLNERAQHDLFVVGRLKPGVTSSQAEAALNVIATEIGQEHPEEAKGLQVVFSRPGLLGNMMRGPLTGFTGVLLGVCGLLLLIACTNLAGILLARASDRRQETAIRLAIGARRGHLIRQLLAESFVLSVLGAIAGLLTATWVTDLLSAWRLPVGIPVTFDLELDYRVMGFAAALSILTTLLFGLAPALNATKTQLVGALRSDTSVGRLRRFQLRDLVVSAQVALSIVILVGCLISLRSLERALDINLGFDPENTIDVMMDLNLQGYNGESGREFQRRLLEKVNALPGVESAAVVNSIPLSLNRITTGIIVEGKPRPAAMEVPVAYQYRISPGYLRTMRTRLLAGRDIEERDNREAPPVALVNQAFADQILPGEEAIGRRIQIGGSQWTKIVGIVEDGKYASLGENPHPVVFRPSDQSYTSLTTLVVRSPLPEAKAVNLVRGAIRELDPSIPLYRAGALRSHLAVQMLPSRIATAFLGGFGLIALLLAATGVYGLMAFAVSRRTREIGIRIAIGATGALILKPIMGRAAALIVLGSAIGLAGALALSGFLSAVLVGAQPNEPGVYILAVTVMGLVALAACLVPARRAMSIQPAAALKQE